MSNSLAGSNAAAGPQFEVTYRETQLFMAASQIGGTLGTLRKGARMMIIGDPDPYYYRVRLPNGIEGFVYKAAGAQSGSLEGLAPDTIEATPDLSAADASSEPRSPAPSVRRPTAAPRPRPSVQTDNTLGYDLSSGDFDVAPPSVGYGLSSSEGNTSRRAAPAPRPNSITNRRTTTSAETGRSLVIVSAEIAVLDSPNIVGHQLTKLRRGDTVSIIGSDSFFYEVEISGLHGFVPRYAGEIRA